ncbi:hypothetical protein V8E51_014583 [Hyaloscypha variabilis]|jgi:limonene-1,2-epoxide hydrolase
MYTINDPEAEARRVFDEFAKCTPENVEYGVELFAPDGKFYALSGNLNGAFFGHDAMRAGFKQMFDDIRGIRYELREVSAKGNVLFMERVENFKYKGRLIESLLACGLAIFGPDGKLTEFRDYYDSAVLETKK